MKTLTNKDNDNHKKVRLPGRVRLVITISALVLFCLAAAIISEVRYDPNFGMRHFSGGLKLNETRQLTYGSKAGLFGRKKLSNILVFQPEETGEYTFTVSDIQGDEGVYLKLLVMDKQLSDYISVDNFKNDDGEKSGAEASADGIPSETMSGTARLNADNTYYVVVESNDTKDEESYSGSFKITVAKAELAEGPAEITTGETVSINVISETRSCVMFRPDESGFYRFDTKIKSKKDSYGSSEIAEVTDDSGTDIKLYSGICYMHEGRDYYIWVYTEDTVSEKTNVDVSCAMIGLETISDNETIGIGSESIIEYDAESSEPVAVWSESDGDPRSSVYDQNGTPVNMDNDSGKDFSNNDKDFALVIYPEDGVRYYIYVGGTFDECKVSIAEYTGDGTTLGPDSVSSAGTEKNESADQDSSHQVSEE